jgi:hypothetical protein
MFFSDPNMWKEVSGSQSIAEVIRRPRRFALLVDEAVSTNDKTFSDSQKDLQDMRPQHSDRKSTVPADGKKYLKFWV